MHSRCAALGEAASEAVPLIAIEGHTTHQESGSRAGGIQVYGVDARFWEFHGLEPGDRVPEAGEVLVSEGLARELGLSTDETLLVRVQKPSSIPVSSLHGRRDDLGQTMRLRVQAVLGPDELGAFSFRPQQGVARAVFVQLGRMQRELELEAQANTLLLGGSLTKDAPASVEVIETAGARARSTGCARRRVCRGAAGRRYGDGGPSRSARRRNA